MPSRIYIITPKWVAQGEREGEIYGLPVILNWAGVSVAGTHFKSNKNPSRDSVSWHTVRGLQMAWQWPSMYIHTYIYKKGRQKPINNDVYYLRQRTSPSSLNFPEQSGSVEDSQPTNPPAPPPSSTTTSTMGSPSDSQGKQTVPI